MNQSDDSSLIQAKQIFSFGSRSLDLSTPHVMGVLNVTPDSFSDGGELFAQGVLVDKALSRAQAMVKAGAAILDIGGESTRPGAREVGSQEEMDRVLPVLEAINAELDVIVSLDSSNPQLMLEAAKYDLGLINDVRALGREGALQAAAQTGLPVCLMHMQGQPDSMQKNPRYQGDVVADILCYLQQRVNDCKEAGIGLDKIMVDPGFGFGKTLAHNLELLDRLEDLQSLGMPVLIGVSRKSMIGTITGKEEKRRLPGSLAAAVVAVMKGARIVRVHDVDETVDAIKICTAVLGRQA